MRKYFWDYKFSGKLFFFPPSNAQIETKVSDLLSCTGRKLAIWWGSWPCIKISSSNSPLAVAQSHQKQDFKCQNLQTTKLPQGLCDYHSSCQYSLHFGPLIVPHMNIFVFFFTCTISIKELFAFYKEIIKGWTFFFSTNLLQFMTHQLPAPTDTAPMDTFFSYSGSCALWPQNFQPSAPQHSDTRTMVASSLFSENAQLQNMNFLLKTFPSNGFKLIFLGQHTK